VSLFHGDITALELDAIVNAANRYVFSDYKQQILLQ
jgi:O-acetyl-ADP-ribose deacetylase (regulator of RNase III)